MKILSHRGLWFTETEKNSIEAIKRAFDNDFGIETDIRDLNTQLVISHNPPQGNEEYLNKIFELYNLCQCDTFLAINIKSDGLDELLERQLNEYKINNYFVFDMSVPDTLNYINRGLKFFCRQSEVEMIPSFYDESLGVWMDQFYSDWINAVKIKEHINKGKYVALVSPELHKHEYKKFWEMLKSSELYKSEQLFLCTDFPLEANNYFFGGEYD